MNLNYELYLAARYGNIIRVKLMLKLGADVHTGNNEALRWAADNGHKDVCKLLIEHGADIDNALKYVKFWDIESYYNKIKTTLMQVKNELKS